MNETLWIAYLTQMAQQAQEDAPHTRLCVGCWYKNNKKPFPPQASSSLCPTCASQTRNAATAPLHHWRDAL